MANKILSWNVRGLANEDTSGRVRTLMQEKRPEILLIQETKINDNSDPVFNWLWRHPWSVRHIPAIGLSGGFLIAWNTDLIEVTDSLEGAYSLSLVCRSMASGFEWLLTGIYGPSKINERHQFLDELEDIRGWSQLPWCLGGDFNLTRFTHERKGNERVDIFMKKFEEFVERYGLVDYTLQGAKFTWSNVNCASRIDRFLTSIDWDTKFPAAREIALPKYGSDHRAVLLDCSTRTRGPTPFRFEIMWFEEPELPRLMEEWWNASECEGSASYKWWYKLKCLKDNLKTWNREVFGRVDLLINNKVTEIEQLELKAETESLSDDEEILLILLRGELKELQKKNEIRWRQKSRTRWRVDGEDNTTFYHKIANGRNKVNSMGSLRINGKEVTDQLQIEHHVVGYYENLYSNDHRVRPLLGGVEFDTISEDQNLNLVKPFTEEEILAALRELSGDRAPGPDGFPMIVFQKCWCIFRTEFMEVIKEFHEDSFIDWRLNTTFITLIPKKTGSLAISDYRPISLIGGIYKILTKALSIRLRVILPSLVSPNQSAFVGKRQILDGILVANECLDSRLKSQEPGILCKIDLAKAYDRILWEFIDYILLRMGFGTKWRNWIFTCMSTASFSILIDGSPKGHFKNQRGLRQGDPISPLLFTLAMEALTRLTLNATSRGYLSGFKVAIEGPEISILQFADDTLMLCDNSLYQILIIKSILLIFSAVSGLTANLKKTVLIGVGHTPNIHDYARVMGCGTTKLPCTYLGMPLGAKYKSTTVWDKLVERMNQKVGGWQKKLLSTGGRVVLLQSVLAQLLTYQMSLIEMPKSVVTKVESKMRLFLWGSTEQKKKYHLVKWSNVCAPKDLGGLGLKSMSTMNQALLCSWLWRYGTTEQALWKNIIDSKYGRGEFGWWPQQVRQSYGCSMWRAIMKNWFNFKEGIECRLGIGDKVKFWKDVWTGSRTLHERFPVIYSLSERKFSLVQEVRSIEQNNSSWNLQLRRAPYDWEEPELASLQDTLRWIQYEEEPDLWWWKWSRNGIFTVHSMYTKLWETRRDENLELINFPSDLVWAKELPLKIKFFFWTALLGRTLTVDNLNRRGQHFDPLCQVCKLLDESIPHSLFHCAFALQVWKEIIGPREETYMNLFAVDSLEEWLSLWPQSTDPDIGGVVWTLIPYATAWCLWKTRNKCVFQNVMADTRRTCSEVKSTIWFWMAVWHGRKRYRFQDIIFHWEEIIMGTFRR